jgi:hypothetical protein
MPWGGIGGRMRKRIMRRKLFVVDGREFEVSLTAAYREVVHLHVTVRALFGFRSFCLMRGLRNLDYFYNYGECAADTTAETEDRISITPRMIASLIRLARQRGWSPEMSKSNHAIHLDNAEANKSARATSPPKRDAEFG